MEITWTELIFNDDHYFTRRWLMSDSFWRRRKSIRDIVGTVYSKKNGGILYLDGHIKKDNKLLLVHLYILPRGRFNLLLGTNTTSGKQYESALIFHDKEFTITKSKPSQITKAIKNHIKDIEAEIEKRFNGEWKYMTDDEKKGIVWEDQD